MSFEKIKITNKGRQLLAKAAAGEPLVFTRIKMGDGKLGGQVIETMTDIINEVVSLGLNNPIIGDKYTIINGNFKNAAIQNNFTGDGTTNQFTLSGKPISPVKVTINGEETEKYSYSNKVVTFSEPPAAGAVILITFNLEGFYWHEISVHAQDPDEGEIMFAYQNAGNLADHIASASSEIIEKVVGAGFTFSSDIEVKVELNESLVFMPISQGQVRTELLIEEENISDEDTFPMYSESKGKSEKVTAKTLKNYIEKEMEQSYVKKPTRLAYTMTAAGWDQESKTYSFEEDYPNAQYDIQIEPAKGYTEEQSEAWGAALIKGDLTLNVATADGEVPAVDLPIYLEVTKK